MAGLLLTPLWSSPPPLFCAILYHSSSSLCSGQVAPAPATAPVYFVSQYVGLLKPFVSNYVSVCSIQLLPNIRFFPSQFSKNERTYVDGDFKICLNQ